MNRQHATTDRKNSERLLRSFKKFGVVIIGRAIPVNRLDEICVAYDEVMKPSSSSDFKAGSTTDRRYFSSEIALDDVCQYPVLLAICADLIGHPFKLKSLLGRTLRAATPAQALHADVAHDSTDAPVVGFILMLDAFTPENGATRFIPASQGGPDRSDRLDDPYGDCEEVLACGEAGSMIIFNASVWHSHTANTTPEPRRSIQGYFGRSIERED